MSEELLPCPFCGGKGQSLYDDGIVLCVADCGASVGSSTQEASKAWNKRKLDVPNNGGSDE